LKQTKQKCGATLRSSRRLTDMAIDAHPLRARARRQQRKQTRAAAEIDSSHPAATVVCVSTTRNETMNTRSDCSKSDHRRAPVNMRAVLDEGNLDWLDDLHDDRIETHWTRILTHDLEANDREFVVEARGQRGAGVFARAVLALAAAYVLVYLMVAAIVYAAHAPDPVSALLPGPPAQAPAPTTDFPLQRPLSRAA
jgi:hypothetical protein